MFGNSIVENIRKKEEEDKLLYTKIRVYTSLCVCSGLWYKNADTSVFFQSICDRWYNKDWLLLCHPTFLASSERSCPCVIHQSDCNCDLLHQGCCIHSWTGYLWSLLLKCCRGEIGPSPARGLTTITQKNGSCQKRAERQFRHCLWPQILGDQVSAFSRLASIRIRAGIFSQLPAPGPSFKQSVFLW